jgi:Phage tail assembly chaperone proteins, E, or 41 or 14
MKVIKLSAPTKINGSEISEINLDLESLRGKDLMALERTFHALYRGEFVPAFSMESRYLMLVAGQASGINPEDLGELKGPDFVALRTEVQNFLLSAG